MVPAGAYVVVFHAYKIPPRPPPTPCKSPPRGQGEKGVGFAGVDFTVDIKCGKRGEKKGVVGRIGKKG